MDRPECMRPHAHRHWSLGPPFHTTGVPSEPPPPQKRGFPDPALEAHSQKRSGAWHSVPPALSLTAPGKTQGLTGPSPDRHWAYLLVMELFLSLRASSRCCSSTTNLERSSGVLWAKSTHSAQLGEGDGWSCASPGLPQPHLTPWPAAPCITLGT